VGQPIALRPDEDWTSCERELLANAASCWNLRFGTEVEVEDEPRTLQEVEVGYSGFICLHAHGVAKSSYPRRIQVCPVSYDVTFTVDRRLALFNILLHELGHILNLEHARDPEAVMTPAILRYPERFSEEDDYLFHEANGGFTGEPPCRLTRISQSELLDTKPECLCSDD
jgi:hypothetical protein